ncbi:MAG TPA: hypothetical protein VGV57_03050 [Thermoleophilaceae bacterium]|nr:hypothetical protein [Thermoleophilaceae bacterium]
MPIHALSGAPGVTLGLDYRTNDGRLAERDDRAGGAVTSERSTERR